MKDPIVKGHPLHAMLSDLPIGITIAGVTFDLLGTIFPLKQWRFAARATHTLALLSGTTTALVGLWDYLAVPRDHPAYRTGAVHGYLNASALLSLLLSLAMRWRSGMNESGESAKQEPAGARGLSLLALLLLRIAGWFGGELVFKLGWRVTPAEHAQLLEDDLHQSGQDEQIEKAHAIVEQYKQEHALLP